MFQYFVHLFFYKINLIANFFLFLGWMSRMRSNEVPLSALNLSSVAVRNDSEDADHILEDDIWTPADAEYVKNNTCMYVVSLVNFKACNHNFFYHNFNPFCNLRFGALLKLIKWQ